MRTENIPGARWQRCDLHVHTPFDREKKFGENLQAAIQALKKEKPQRLGEIADRFVASCRGAADGEGLDLVALTDHNSIDGYRYLKPQFDSLTQQARDQGLFMPAILPGVEFSVGGERPIHFLVVFAASTNPDQIDGAIRYVFGTSDHFDPKTGAPRATGQSVGDFLTRLYDYCRPSSGDRKLEFVLLPAHADSDRGVAKELATNTRKDEVAVATTLWDEMRGHLRQRVITRQDWHGFQTVQPFESLPQAFKELLWRWAAARRGEDWDQLTDGQRARYREQRHWPLVECSDPHRYEEIGIRYTWLKMEVPDVEGIRLALLDPESRLRRMADGPPVYQYPRMERVGVRHTDFFDNVEIPVSPCLTTLIGGRGSGKSTIVEYIRYALDRNRKDDFSGDRAEETRGAVENVLMVKNEQDFGENPGTLLPQYEIEVDVIVAGRQYRIRRVAAGVEVIRDPRGSSPEKVPLDVRSLISPRILSQRQIARIARDPSSQRMELDALVDRDQISKLKDEREHLMERISEFQAKRARLKARRTTLPARKTELQKVADQIAFLEQAGQKEVLSRFKVFEEERRWIESALLELETRAKNLSDQAEIHKDGAESLLEAPTKGSSRKWLESASKRIKERLQQANRALHAEAAAFRELAATLISEREKEWQSAYTSVRQEYDALSQAMRDRGVDFSAHEKLLQQRALLTREVAELEAIAEQLDQVGKDIRMARSDLIQVHERRLTLRRNQARTLENLDADVRLEVLPFRDRRDFESRRDEWFSGAGVQERDWTTLVEYLFAPNGSLADRLGLLVDALRADIERTASLGRKVDGKESQVIALLGSDSKTKLTAHFFGALERAERVRLDELERFLPEDLVEARVRKEDGRFQPISTGSVGQRSTAILSLLLSAGDQPLVIDQPEDDLDNRYIYDVVVSLLRRRKFSRQIIIATHNANIPVNGDAELIVALGVDERIGKVLVAGSIDRPQVKDQVSVIMEGSAEAFRLRRERYGY